jgi:phage portal protein BeeE
LLLEDGMEFEATEFASTDSQFLELRRLSGREIAAGLRVPAIFVGDLDRAVWQNVEELSR